MMFGFGKKKEVPEVPLKEQQGYGAVKHFFDYTIAEAKKNLKKYGININAYNSFNFTEVDNSYTLCYVPEQNHILLYRVQENGKIGEPFFGLTYQGDKLHPNSYLGGVKGERLERFPFDERAYALVSRELLMPAFVNKKSKNGNITYVLKETNKKIQWRGLGHDSGRIGGELTFDPRNHSQVI